MSGIKLSKKIKNSKHGRQYKKGYGRRKALRVGEITAVANRSDTIQAAGIKVNAPTIAISESITVAQKRILERSGVRIVAVEDMAKRREENVSAFRKMGKPGYAFNRGSVVKEK